MARVGSGVMVLAHSWNVKMAARLEIEIAFIGGSREFSRRRRMSPLQMVTISELKCSMQPRSKGV